jgi:hypothetical protein
MMLKWIVEKYVVTLGDMDWIHLAQDRDRFQVLVKTVLNFQFP